MPGQGFSGIAGYNRFRVQGGAPNYGYWDTYGAGILPGGSLQASPDYHGSARSMPGIDVPVVGYPETGWNPNDPLRYPYTNSLPGVGLPNRGDIGGAGGPYPLPDMNVPPNENVSPTPVNTYYTDPVTGASYPSPTPRRRYPDLSGLPPVTVNPPGSYPIPGLGGLPSNWNGGQSWQSNARGGSSNAGGFSGMANSIAASSGFGGGLVSSGQGGWQTVSPDSQGLFGSVNPGGLPGGMPRGYIL